MSARDRVDPWVVELADGLAAALREMVRPHLGLTAARGLAGTAVGGDTTFAIDELAENEIGRFLDEWGAPVAVYSEDKGLRTWGDDPRYVLIVDPIDGTRPAAAGFEAACVSIAVARWSERPTMADVVYAVVQEIKEGGVFRGERGGGVDITDGDGVSRPLRLSRNTDLSRLFWTIGFRGRPAVELVAVLGDLIDRSSVDGAVFDIGSATYSMTRILTGQLDAYVDVGPRMIEVAPWVEGRFRAVGNGGVLNNAPYDVAATTMLLEEAGCFVTDTLGRSLGSRPLLGSDVTYQMAVVASANDKVQRSLLMAISAGMERLASMPAPGPGA
jgi:myo-inositol-1(or 4)-monophosphatase